MIIKKLFSKPDKRILVIADVLDASYNVFLAFSLEHLSKNGDVFYKAISAKDYELSVRKRKIKAILVNDKITHVIFLRYSQSDGKEILDLCHDQGAKTFYFIDDDFFAIAENTVSGLLANHTSEDVIMMRHKLISSVNVVLCSTEYLKKSLDKRFSPRLSIAPFYPVFIKHFKAEEKRNTIGYMGSKGHKFDLEMLIPVIIKLMNKYPNLRFETFGSIQMPAELNEFQERTASHTNAKSYEDFLDKLSKLGWSIGLAPLENNEVNKCKAFTKFIEYTSANIPCAASDFLVYQQVVSDGNGELCKDDQWFDCLENMLLRDNSLILEKAKKAISNYAIDKQAKRLITILA